MTNNRYGYGGYGGGMSGYGGYGGMSGYGGYGGMGGMYGGMGGMGGMYGEYIDPPCAFVCSRNTVPRIARYASVNRFLADGRSLTSWLGLQVVWEAWA